MAARAIARLCSSYGERLRTMTAELQQEKRRILVRGFSSTASPSLQGQGSETELKSSLEESSTLSSEGTIEPTSANTLQSPLDENKFEASIKVGRLYLGYIAGSRGATKGRIERSTKTQISLPSQREFKNNPYVVINGPSQNAVDAAESQIRGLLAKAEKHPNLQYSHFISIPLAFPPLVERVKSFRDSVLADEREANSYVSWFPETQETTSSSLGSLTNSKKISKTSTSHIADPVLENLFSDVDEELSGDDTDNETEVSSGKKLSRAFFINPARFHLTILMLKLATEESVQKAAEVLQGVKKNVLEVLADRPVTIHLQGMETMRGNLAETRVLYMRIKETGEDDRLVRACHAILDAYTEAGLVPDPDRALKLHATLMNAAHARRKDLTFDARNILLKHRLDDWGEHEVKEIQLSQRFLYDENRYYHCCASIPVPSGVSLDTH